MKRQKVHDSTQRKSNERFTKPDRVWSTAKSKELGDVRIQRLIFKKANEDGSIVPNGVETIRIFSEDLTKGCKYFKQRMDQLTDDQIKKRFGLTRLSIQQGDDTPTWHYTDFVGDLKMEERDGRFICRASLRQRGTKKEIEISGCTLFENPYDARSDFFMEFNLLLPGCIVKGDLLDQYDQKSNPNR